MRRGCIKHYKNIFNDFFSLCDKEALALEEYKNRFTVLTRDDICNALVEEGLSAKGGKLSSLGLFLDHIRFPALQEGGRTTSEEGTVAYYKDDVADAKDWILKWDNIFLGLFEYEGNPDETFEGCLETVHGLKFRNGCTGKEELEDGQWFCEKVQEEYGEMRIRRYWIRCGSDTFADSVPGELCSYLMLDGYVFDEYDARFGALESFLNVDEILEQVTED